MIDPGDLWDGFDGINHVLLTHAHFDHIYGLNEIIQRNPIVRIYTNEAGYSMLLNSKKNLSQFNATPFIVNHHDCIYTVVDNQSISLSEGQSAKAIYTPGHNPSCISWIIDNLLFTGDAYIPGIKTVTNLPGGDKLQAEESIIHIKALGNNRIIYPGHQKYND